MTEVAYPEGKSLIARVLGKFAVKQFWKDLAFKILRDGVQRAISGIVNAIIDVFKGTIPPEHRRTSPSPSPSSIFDRSQPSYGSYGSRYREGSVVPVSTQPTRGDTLSFPDLPANF